MKFFENPDDNKKFIQSNIMGPSAVLILQELLQKLTLHKDMRVLDLGCGTGLTSMYIAKATGAQVFAADLWIAPEDNFKRFKQFGLDRQIIPLKLDAVQPLPFAKDYFDAVISIDAFHYFAAQADYLDKNIIPFVKTNGIIAAGIVGRQDEDDQQMLALMQPYLQGETNFHSLSWWTALWQKSQNIEITHAFEMHCHQAAWQEWLTCGEPFLDNDIEMMKADGGKFFNTIGLAARVTKAKSSEEPKPWQSILSK